MAIRSAGDRCSLLVVSPMWTTTDIRYMREHASLGAEELAKRMGRSPAAVKRAGQPLPHLPAPAGEPARLGARAAARRLAAALLFGPTSTGGRVDPDSSCRAHEARRRRRALPDLRRAADPGRLDRPLPGVPPARARRGAPRGDRGTRGAARAVDGAPAAEAGARAWERGAGRARPAGNAWMKVGPPPSRGSRGRSVSMTRGTLPGRRLLTPAADVPLPPREAPRQTG